MPRRGREHLPHQCLGCGRTYPQGSNDLLKGCAGCGGTRFFYSKESLTEADRHRLAAEQSADVKEVLAELLSERGGATPKELARTWDEWVSVAKPARKETRQATLPEGKAEPASSPAPAPVPVNVPAAPAPAPVPRDSPGTVQVIAKGQYAIDVEALMQANPVVIEKDGVFMIHLPSVFESRRRR